MKIVFCLFGRLGDVCCGLPAFYALRDKYPNAELTWAGLEIYQSLMPSFALKRFFGSPPIGSGWPHWANEKEFDKVIKAQPAWRHKEWERSRQHAVDLIARWSGVDLRPQDKIIRAEISDKDRNYIDSLKLPPRFVAFCAGPTISAGNYWQSADRIKMARAMGGRSLTVISIGGNVSPISGTLNMCGKTSYLQTIELINRAQLYIGPDNGCTWLACAARDTPKVCVVDKNRLNTGVVGFEKYLYDENIKDVFIQNGVDAIIAASSNFMK